MKKKIINSNSIFLVLTIILEIFMYIITKEIKSIYKLLIPLLFIYLTFSILIINRFKKSENITLYIIYLLGLLLRIIYIMSTNVYTRQHDVGTLTDEGHLKYIYTLYQTSKLPLTNHSQFYHPPLWHIIAAIFLKINKLFNISLNKSFEGLQFITTFLSSYIIIIVDKIQLNLNIKKRYRYLTNLFFALHPTLIILSGSINNDCLLLFMESLTILNLINWEKDSNWKNTIYLALTTGLCVMSKANGIIIALPILFTFIIKIPNKKKERINYIKKIITFATVSIPIGIWYQIRNTIKFSNNIIPTPIETLSTRSHSIISRLFTIDFKNIYTIPNTFKDYNLPSFLIKSSIYGEYSYNNVKLLTNIMTTLNIILITLSILFIIKYLLNKNRTYTMNILIITWITSIIMMYIFNINYPYGCSMDFRYIAITLLPGIIIIAYTLSNLKNKYLSLIIEITCYIFFITNIMFVYIQ